MGVGWEGLSEVLFGLGACGERSMVVAGESFDLCLTGFPGVIDPWLVASDDGVEFGVGPLAFGLGSDLVVGLWCVVGERLGVLW